MTTTWPEGTIGVPTPEDIDTRPRAESDVVPFDTAFRPAVVKKVIDGDTYLVTVDIGFCVSISVEVRLVGWKCGIADPRLGVNTFETTLRGDTTLAMKQVGLEAKALCQSLVGVSQRVLICTRKGGTQESFNRWLGLILVQGPLGWTSLGDYLLEKNLATVWWDGWQTGKTRPK
jgi:hypothetical protein